MSCLMTTSIVEMSNLMDFFRLSLNLIFLMFLKKSLKIQLILNRVKLTGFGQKNFDFSLT